MFLLFPNLSSTPLDRLPDMSILPVKDGRECADAMCNIVKVFNTHVHTCAFCTTHSPDLGYCVVDTDLFSFLMS